MGADIQENVKYNVDEGQTRLSQNDASKTKLGGQILAGLAANLTMLSSGLSFSWTVAFLVQLEDGNSDISLTADEISWLASALMIGACFGPILSAIFTNIVGRKWFLYCTSVPFFTCWLLIYLAQSFSTLLIARFICGIAVGATFGTLPVYLAEIAETKVRGALGTMSYAFLGLGTLINYCSGPYILRKTLSVISAVPTLVFLLIYPWMPESPYFYLKKNSVDAATKSLTWLRGTESVAEELREMVAFVEAEKQQRGTIYELITVPTNRRASLIVVVLLAAQQSSGYIAIVSYVSVIFRGASSDIDANTAVIITGSVSFLVNILATCIVDKLGRKPLTMTSSIGAAVCLMIIAIYFHLKAAEIDVKVIQWLPLFTIICYYVFFSIGLGPIPYTVLAEIFPTGVKAWAATVASIYGSILGAAVPKIYQITIDAYGDHVIFYGFAICELLLSVALLFLLPETKGKSFSDIQDFMQARTAKAKAEDQ